MTGRLLSYRVAYKRLSVESLRAVLIAALSLDDLKVVVGGLLDLV